MSDEQVQNAEVEEVLAEEAPQAVEAAEEEAQPSVPEEVVSALAARAAFYETLAGLYWMPLTNEQVENMAEADFSAYAELNDDFKDGVNDITRYLRKRNTGTRDEMAVDFTGTFAGVKVYEGKTAVPYKSVFTSEDGLMYQEGYQEVFRAFKNECVKKRSGLDYPEDHISFLCEFMALMSRRTAEALLAGDIERAAHCVDASKVFLDDNILSWFDQLSERALLIIKTRFYKGVLKISKGFFTLDRETLTDLHDVIVELAAKPAEAPAAE